MVGENVVASEVIDRHSRAISVLAGAVDVDDIVINVFLLVEVFVISRVAVGDFIGVSIDGVLLLKEILLGQLHVRAGDSAEVIGENVVASKVVNGHGRAVSRLAATVDVNNSIVDILFLVEILIVGRVTVGDLIRVLVNRVEQLLVVSRSVVMTLDLVKGRELHVSGGGVKSPVVSETMIVNDIIVVGRLVLELLVISRVAVAKLIRLLLDLGVGLMLVLVLSSQLDPVSCETVVVNDVIFRVNLVLELLIVTPVAISNLVRLLLEESKVMHGVLKGRDAAKECKNCNRSGFHVY